MTLVHPLTHPDAPVRTFARPRLRASPRLALGSGERVGVSVCLASSLPVAVAIRLACDLAQSSSLVVSLAITPPFQKLPGVAGSALVEAGVPAERLELSVSRSAVEDAGIETLLALSAIRDQGIGVALRGFTARSAGLLPRLPLSAVVFAPRTIRGVPGSIAATASMGALLALARGHGLRTVVTGIETEVQRAVLSGLGGDAGEGSLFGTIGQTHAAA